MVTTSPVFSLTTSLLPSRAIDWICDGGMSAVMTDGSIRRTWLPFCATVCPVFFATT
nr:hypothetical protein [Paraburkholderia caballeronis]